MARLLLLLLLLPIACFAAKYCNCKQKKLSDIIENMKCGKNRADSTAAAIIDPEKEGMCGDFKREYKMAKALVDRASNWMRLKKMKAQKQNERKKPNEKGKGKTTAAKVKRKPKRGKRGGNRGKRPKRAARLPPNIRPPANLAFRKRAGPPRPQAIPMTIVTAGSSARKGNKKEGSHSSEEQAEEKRGRGNNKKGDRSPRKQGGRGKMHLYRKKAQKGQCKKRGDGQWIRRCIRRRLDDKSQLGPCYMKMYLKMKSVLGLGKTCCPKELELMQREWAAIQAQTKNPEDDDDGGPEDEGDDGSDDVDQAEEQEEMNIIAHKVALAMEGADED